MVGADGVVVDLVEVHRGLDMIRAFLLAKTSKMTDRRHRCTSIYLSRCIFIHIRIYKDDVKHTHERDEHPVECVCVCILRNVPRCSR